MDTWIITATLSNGDELKLTTYASGVPKKIDPPGSPFSGLTFIDGFDDASNTSIEVAPRVSILAASEEKVDVVGLAVCIYINSMMIRSAAIVRSVTHVPDLTPKPSREEIERKLAQSSIDATEWYQNVTNTQREGDDSLVALSAFQADKIAAILGAARRGHIVYDEMVPKILSFLNYLAIEARPGPRFIATGATAELWQKIDVLPWPRGGTPVDQPDIEGDASN